MHCLVDGRRAAPPVCAETDAARQSITFLSWDTEGGDRIATNLLRSPATMPSGAPRQAIAVAVNEQALTITVQSGRELVLPFDPRVTPTTALSAGWTDLGAFLLPAIINAPDFGPMLLTEATGAAVHGRLEGSRKDKYVNVILVFPEATPERPIKLVFTPLLLSPPPGLKDPAMWRLARRGWLNALQPCARWGEQNKPFSSPPGILGNNVISDPASCSLWFYTDQVLFLPEPAPGVNLAPMVRRTVDFWLDQRMRKDAEGRLTGELTCYWDYGNFLDADAGPLIAAWDYVECTGDREWLVRRMPKLEMVADFLARRDIDNDGLIEATQSGNLGTLHQPNRSCSWWDALNCGHKDAYTNALTYRAWRCGADLEKQLGRSEQQKRYTILADRLKAAYAKALMNPATGWLAMWKSRDGELHDYAGPTFNGLAIEYGLIEGDAARAILDRLWAKMQAVGFTRWDLGVPPMLLPVRRGDYLVAGERVPDGFGCPKRDDGTDTFGHYQNGGITPGHVLHFLMAHYLTGQNERADRILAAMLERQFRGEFHNGVIDAAEKGMEWTTWDGKPCGYEGYLADSFRFLQAVLLRQPEFRAKLYRPLSPSGQR